MPDHAPYGNSPQTDKLWQLIGHTPFIALRYRYQGGSAQEVLVKCEQYNLTGSIKDRLALYILQKAREQRKLKPDDLILDASSGNMGIAYAAIGRALGHRVRILVPEGLSMEHRTLIKSYGAEIQFGSTQQAEQVFLPGQFARSYHAEVHEKTTGREIGHQLLLMEVRPDAFVAGAGSGGTLMGVGKYLHNLYPWIRLHPVEPAESRHRIEGIGNGLVPRPDGLNEAVRVSDGDAILMAQKLAQAGLPVGISSGANLLAAIRLQQEPGGKKVVITIFPDDARRYMATDLFREEPVKPGYLSPAIELLDHVVLK